MIDIADKVTEVIEQLKQSPEPFAWTGDFSARNGEAIFTYSLPIPDVDGGSVDVWDEVGNRVEQDMADFVATRNLEGVDPLMYEFWGFPERELTAFEIADASMRVEKNEPADTYDYYLTFAIFTEFKNVVKQ